MTVSYQDALRATASPESWRGLDAGARLSALQAIENHVAAEQGRAACPVAAHPMECSGGTAYGTYDPSTRTISINSDLLGPGDERACDPAELVDTILHEGRHAFQDQAVRGEVACDPARAAEWAENMDAYIAFERNPRRYWEQPIEADAREYADLRRSLIDCERASLSLWDSEAQGSGVQAEGFGDAKQLFESSGDRPGIGAADYGRSLANGASRAESGMAERARSSMRM